MTKEEFLAQFDEWYAGHYKKVFRSLYRKTRDAAVAEELTNYGFTRLLEYPSEKFPSIKNILAFLITVGKNKFVDEIRRQGTAEILSMSCENGEAVSNSVTDKRPGPDKSFEQRDDSRFLRILISQLEKEQDQDYILLYILDFTNEEIAQMRCEKIENTRINMNCARTNLRNLVKRRILEMVKKGIEHTPENLRKFIAGKNDGQSKTPARSEMPRAI